MIKLFLIITVIFFMSYNSGSVEANCSDSLNSYFYNNAKHEVQLTVIRPQGDVVYASNTLYYYTGFLTNGNSFPAVFSSKTKNLSDGKVQLFDVEQQQTSFYDRSGIILHSDGQLQLNPIWGGMMKTNLTCIGSGPGAINYGFANGNLITLQFK